MNIPIWIKSAYVTIGNPPFFRMGGLFIPSEEGKPPRFGFPQIEYHIYNFIARMYYMTLLPVI